MDAPSYLNTILYEQFNWSTTIFYQSLYPRAYHGVWNTIDFLINVRD